MNSLEKKQKFDELVLKLSEVNVSDNSSIKEMQLELEELESKIGRFSEDRVSNFLKRCEDFDPTGLLVNIGVKYRKDIYFNIKNEEDAEQALKENELIDEQDKIEIKEELLKWLVDELKTI